MRPNREAQPCARGAVKPSVVVVPTCKPSKDSRFTRGRLGSNSLRCCVCSSRGTSNRTVAWNPASKVAKTWNTACGDGACDPHRELITVHGEIHAHAIQQTTRTATSSRSVLLSFYDFGAGASESRNEINTRNSAKLCCLTNETDGRVSGGDRATSLTNKVEPIMNKIMVSFFAVILAAFAVSAVMRERVKAEAACHAVEVAR